MAIITNPTNGQSTPISTVDELHPLVNKITRSIYSGAAVTNRYTVFDKTPLEFGAIIESVRVPATGSTTVNPNATTFSPSAFPKFAKRYISAPQKKVYYVDISYDHLKRVVDGQANFSDLVATIINANNEGERRDANAGYKLLFADSTEYVASSDIEYVHSLIGSLKSDDENYPFARFGGFLTTEKTDLPAIQYERLESPTWKALWKEFKKVSKDMSYDNDTYSNGFQCEVRMEDLVLVIPSKVMEDADVEFLAYVKNLEKTGLIPQIVETDGNVILSGGNESTGYTHSNVAIICDRRALGRVVLDRHVRDMDVPGDKHRYELYVTDEFYFDPNYKCYAVIFDDPVADTMQVNVTNTTTAPVNTKEVTG